MQWHSGPHRATLTSSSEYIYMVKLQQVEDFWHELYPSNISRGSAIYRVCLYRTKQKAKNADENELSASGRNSDTAFVFEDGCCKKCHACSI